MATASPARVRSDLAGFVHRGAGVHDFSLAAARILAGAVPFDGVCVVTMDPESLLPTSEVVDNALPQAATARMTEIELAGQDFNAFGALARSSSPAASLSEATGGELERSQRHCELRQPNGFGDELRAVLIGDDAVWGALTLLRGSDRRDFTPAEVALVAAVSGNLAEGLRRAMLLDPAQLAERSDGEETAGLVLLAADNTIALADAAAERWLAELADGRPSDAPPPPVTAVASRARSIVHGGDTARPLARARVRTPSGRWLIVRASTLGDDHEAPTAVILEPARSHELAPLAADAYQLTERERAVTELVAQGLSTDAIAGTLHLSPWTVQDHLKAIFDKVGARTRGELVARVFFERHAPRLTRRR